MSARPILSTSDLEMFFEPHHHALGERLSGPALDALLEANDDPRALAGILGALGLYRYFSPSEQGQQGIDVRALVLIREALGYVSPLADAVFAVQGLGTYPIVRAGSPEQRARYLAEALQGRRIAAFALTEPEAGSDVAAMQATAQRDGAHFVIDAEKTLISNATIADHFVIFACTDPPLGRRGISAFIVEAGAPGVQVSPIAMSVAHPIGAVSLRECRVPAHSLLGEPGQGFALAMHTLDTFRISVGAAAVGMARRALVDAIAHVRHRRQFGVPLSKQQLVRASLAEMATELDAARLLVLRAAHKRDLGGERVSMEAAMAKLYATEAAQRIIDKAVQLHGGRGVVLGTEVERLYREIRPLRIYEGTSEIQKLIIAKELLGE